ncbi:hypothetical protein I547_3819 [Mycobacterium kansasii 824]|uniref:Uncharacterized protein n=1 Tax=Mycobacterium kansasii TaxID=1768 RepID=A0A1V3XGW3_MYCKA|nr:hypothetical protein I547_3819 [Mycobacterium kansasii 824]OOK78338.1 hypothetical protein BZL30_2320 [Mycobacterium kansasii]
MRAAAAMSRSTAKHWRLIARLRSTTELFVCAHMGCERSNRRGAEARR